MGPKEVKTHAKDAGTSTVPAISFARLGGEEVNVMAGRTLGTFKGVFVPTILNLLGLMMYLRQGWVVGNAGLLGSLSIVFFSTMITGITALCISSIITNIRIGSGGVFSLVSQSLGLQVGGSIGIPLYLVQSLSSVLYMFGFIEAWTFVFPDHPRVWVTIILSALLFLIAFVGTRFAFRVQVLIMFLVVVALGSIFGGIFRSTPRPWQEVELWGSFADASYWELFAIYFPAVTGIKVGASMSGSLIRPRRSIPVGTMFAWGISSFIYIALCFWYALMGSSEELRTNFLFSVENAYVSELVLIGIMCSCFTAALTSIIAAPRVLQAVSSHDILPFLRTFKPLSKNEPRRAFIGTAVLITIILILFRDINVIAPVITQFFIVIYLVINVVLVIEQRLNLVSFRPEWRLPIWLPILGSILSLTAMLIISPILGLISLVLIIFLYLYLGYKRVETPWETVQSGLLVAMSEWLMRRAVKSGSRGNRRIWKPDLLMPVSSATELKREHRILYSMLHPQGSLQILLFRRKVSDHKAGKNFLKRMISVKEQDRLSSVKVPFSQRFPEEVRRTLRVFQDQGVYASASLLETRDYVSGLDWVAALAENFFPSPNSLFISIEGRTSAELNTILQIASREHKAVIFAAYPPLSGPGREDEVVIWVRDQMPNWHLSLSLSNLDYAVLLGYQIKTNWKAHLRLVCVVSDPTHERYAEEYLHQLSQLARLGERVSIHVLSGNFKAKLQDFASADLHLIGMGDSVDKRHLMQVSGLVSGPCLFVKDSGAGLESALV